MSIKTAEIIAIGDELVSGQRLDTNSQWLSSRLSELGLEPSFHSCVGDRFADGIKVFEHAISRADIVICTGGIGPTQDDLTRQQLAQVADQPLELRSEIEAHIRSIFSKYGREMPENNRIQAYFPAGSNIIPNSEGTAPGIDITVGASRIFALPGVPYEMKEMWDGYVQPQLLASLASNQTIEHHVIHCFGAGESQVELMLDGLTDRGNVPRVGITASQATISLRITAFGADASECNSQISSAKQTIDQKLGELVFGENGQELQDVLVDSLSKNNQTLAILDFGFGGAAALAIFNGDKHHSVLRTAQAKSVRDFRNIQSIERAASDFLETAKSDFAIVIGAPRKDDNKDHRVYDIAFANTGGTRLVTQKYSGHSGLIEARTVKQILNQFRLYLAENQRAEQAGRINS